MFVCANGVLSAEHIISRKHTSGLDQVESIDPALDAFLESLKGFNQTYEQLRSRRINRTKAHPIRLLPAAARQCRSSLTVCRLDWF